MIQKIEDLSQDNGAFPCIDEVVIEDSCLKYIIEIQKSCKVYY